MDPIFPRCICWEKISPLSFHVYFVLMLFGKTLNLLFTKLFFIKLIKQILFHYFFHLFTSLEVSDKRHFLPTRHQHHLPKVGLFLYLVMFYFTCLAEDFFHVIVNYPLFIACPNLLEKKKKPKHFCYIYQITQESVKY